MHPKKASPGPSLRVVCQAPRRDHGLRPFWGEPELAEPGLVEHVQHGRALVQVPDLVPAGDPVPPGQGARGEQEQDRRGRRTGAPRGLYLMLRAEGLAKEAPLRMGEEGVCVDEAQGASFRTSST